MPQSDFSSRIDDNIRRVQELFRGDMTLKERRFAPRYNPECRCVLFYIDSLVNVDLINEGILAAITRISPIPPGVSGFDYILRSGLATDEVIRLTGEDDMLTELLGGNAVLFIEGSATALALNTRGFPTRGISEPESERVLRGSREGFIEAIMVNVSMLRRRLMTHDMKFEFQKIGQITRTTVAICYIEGLAEPKVLEELRRRLGRIRFDAILDSNYISERIRDNPRSPFRTVGTTERPDVAASKLLEGRVAVLVDGSPVALTVPCIFTELMQSPDDYYLNYYYASFGRLMRMACAFLSFSIPAVFLALITYHQELIPPPLIISISRARQGVPLPSFLEALLILLAFDLLRETGTRMPTSVGQSLSIVGALVLGQSAVEARFVSAPMIIVLAFAGITSLIVPRIAGAVSLIKYLLLCCAALFGLYGYVAGMTVVLAYLFSMRSFGISYMAYSSMFGVRYWQDIYVRAPWSKMKVRPFFSKNRSRTGGEAE